MDFTLKTYPHLLSVLRSAGYTFQPFHEFLTRPSPRSILLRHDVDQRPENSLAFARIQHALGIRGTYYFRIVSQSFNEKIIREIATLGHEIGYHYEDVELVFRRQKIKGKRQKGDIQPLLEESILSFKDNLENLRRIVPIRTICMHGSPLSPFDNRMLWEKYNYRDYGIIGEPYFDLDFTKVLYLTDTGRRWDGDKFNIRDKNFNDKDTKSRWLSGTQRTQREKYQMHSTLDIIRLTESGQLPDQVMMTFHPQRWTDEPWLWVKEVVSQRVKNVIKYLVIRIR